MTSRLLRVASVTAAAILACVGLLAAAPSAQAGSFDPLFPHVPSSADAVIAVDQARLVGHPSYAQLKSVATAQGGGAGVFALEDLGLKAGEDFLRTVSFRIGRYAEAAIVQGGGLDPAKLAAAARARLAAGFKEGTVAGRAWFLIAKKVQAAQLADGVLVVGSASAVKKALELAGGKGKAVTAKAGFKAMIKAAAAGAPTVFGTSWVPKRDRETLAAQGAKDLAAVERTHFSATGDGAMTVRLVAYTGSTADAGLVAEGVQSKIERKIINSMPMKLLGLAALAKTVKVTAEGKTAVAASTLTDKQVASLAGMAGKVIKMMEAQAKAEAGAAGQGGTAGEGGEQAASPEAAPR